jgi:hypothetical protein
MSSLSDQIDQLKSLADRLGQFGKVEPTKPALQKAQRELGQIESEIRLIKKSITLDMQNIRQQYSEKSANAGSGGSAVFSIFGKRGSAGKWRADAKRNLAMQKAKELQPYERIKLLIDGQLVNIAQTKAQLKELMKDAA